MARLFPGVSRSRLQQWIRADRVFVDGRPGSPSQRLRGGEALAATPLDDPRAGAYEAEDIPLAIVHEDDSIIVIDKPAGLVMHPASGNWQGTLLNALLAHAPALEAVPRAGIVHRLDKDTSGLVVVAKTVAAQADLVRQLQARTVTRVYLAVVHGIPAREGIVDAPVGRHPTQRTKMAVVERGRPARTRFRLLEAFRASAQVECRLETGRTHQIRVHMMSIGHPLLGDPTYGRRPAADERRIARQALHATRLALVHPALGREMSWDSPPPPDFEHLCAALREELPR